MRETLDGCPEFDGQVLEAAFGSTDGATRAHLDRCPRCRDAAAHYGRAAAALEGRPVPPIPPSARSPLGPGIAVALVAGLLGVGFLIARPGRTRFEVDAGPGAKVRIAEGRRAEVRAGRVRFRVSGLPAVVETPQGEVRAEEADFTVEVEETWRDADAGEDAAMTGTQRAGTAVTVAVAAGVVWWMARDGTVEIPAGRTEARPKPAAAPVAPSAPAAPAVPPVAAKAPDAPPGKEPPKGSTVTGRILDEETGEPVSAATVRLIFPHARRPPAEEPSATPDGEGRFRFTGIAGEDASSEAVLVLADGYAEGLFPEYDARDSMRAGKDVNFGDLWLPRGARVEGRVLTRDGKSVPGARILFCRDTPETFPASFSPAYAVEAGTSNDEGHYALPRVPPCRADILRHTVYALSSEGFGWAWLPILAGRKDLEGQDIVLAATATLAVEVKDAEGKPVVGAGIVAEPHFRPLGAGSMYPPSHQLFLARPPEAGALFSATTGEDGTARLPRLPVEGESCAYDVVAWKAGFSPGWKDGVRVAPGSGATATVVLAAVRTWAVTGTVRTRGGDPVAGAEVNVIGKFARTDAEGRFRMEGFDPATVNFLPWGQVDAEGFANAFRWFTLARVGDTEGIDFLLEPAVPLEGRVADDSGKPLAGIRVGLVRMVNRPDGAVQQHTYELASTGEDGRFAFARASEGNWLLYVPPPQPYEDWETMGYVPAKGGDRTVEVVLHRAPAVTCRITAELFDPDSGAPLDPDQAMLVRDEPPKVGVVTFGFVPQPRMESGRVVFEKCRPGDWILWVLSKGRPAARQPLTIREGQAEARLRIPIPKGGTIRGRVEFPGPRPEGRLWVAVRWPGEVRSAPQWARPMKDPPGWIGCVDVLDDGSFTVEEAMPGRLALSGEFPGCRFAEEAEVLAGGIADVVLRPRSVGRIRFRTGATSGAGSLIVSVSEDRSKDPKRFGFGGPRAKDLDWTANVEPGTVRWKAEFRESDEVAGDFGPPAEGEVSVAAGEVKEVVIPVAR